MKICRVCNSEETTLFSIKKTNYIHCRNCGSICTDENCFETTDNQRLRYEKHHNSLADDGYRSFLEAFINPVFKAVHENKNETETLQKIMDYGSGPEPALCQLLQEYRKNGRYLSESCEIRGWDPFFAPETAFFDDGADLVTCLEVAEHFEKPLDDMKKLCSSCKSGGYVAVGTMLLSEETGADYGHEYDTFRNWWYRSDATHVAFYTLKGLVSCAESAGLTFIKAVTDRAFLFRKTV
ncbi:MAG: class I SAM-dependent methyltransferase [Treponema sp.]|nr:class I SAM-dependent methyltransferase [Candidatus Treponema caballi]